MKKRPGKSESEDELRPEYDLSKMKFFGRGIYAERYRSGTKVVLLGEDDVADEERPESDSGTGSSVC